MKELNINGIHLAKYEIEGDTIFIKTSEQGHTPPYNEDKVIYLISVIEDVELRQASFLNVE